ncbi:MAG: hypothetical protein C3F02_03810 [Parcubacteria group bacterium]|nr:MAG: hypothetical protein C3F02_03810 [Parcubacteria group bacterium]
MFNDVSGQSPRTSPTPLANKFNGAATGNPVTTDLDVFVMPGKFFPDRGQGKKPAGRSGTKKIIIIASIILSLVVALVAGAIFYLTTMVNNARNDDNAALNNSANQNTNQAPTNEAPANSLQNQITNNVNGISNEIPTSTSTTTPGNGDNPPEITQNLDVDNDGLTVDEEALFFTNIARDDSDRDGYKDGQEITNLFNPLVPGQGLENSGLVTRYKNENFSYSVLIPKNWLASPTNTEQSEVMFLTNSETGESIDLKVTPNSSQQSLDTLKINYFAGTDRTENFSLAGLPALRTQTKILLVTDKYIYFWEYNLGESALSHFPAVLEMMLKSFELIKIKELDVQPL